MNINHHIRYLSSNFTIPNDHIKYLEQLKQSGFEPRVIYDIGACVLHWTNVAKVLWPSAKIIVFDAWDKPAFLYKEQELDHFIGVLSDKDGKCVKFYQNDMYPGGNSYYKEIPNPHIFPEDSYNERMTHTLDSVVKANGFPFPDLVKIDVQGSEIDIINGARDTFLHVQHLIVELQSENYNEGAPKVHQSLPYIESLGWKCVAPLFCNNGPDGDYGFARV